jgi:protein-tyrosine-phosphatase
MALLRAQAAKIYRLDVAPVRVISAGTNAFTGSPAHPYAVQAAREVGLDLQNHRATLLTPDLIDRADWIFTMTRAHRDSILEFMPAAMDRVRMLSRNGDDIAEPAGQSLERYRRCREQMAACLRDIIRIVEKS